MDEKELLSEYRKTISGLILHKSEAPIFPKADSCVGIVLEEILKSAKSSIEILINHNSISYFTDSIRQILREKRNAISATRFCVMSTIAVADPDLSQWNGIPLCVLQSEMRQAMGSLSFLLVDAEKLIVFGSTPPRVAAFPFSSDGIAKNCESFFGSLREASKFDDTEANEEDPK